MRNALGVKVFHYHAAKGYRAWYLDPDQSSYIMCHVFRNGIPEWYRVQHSHVFRDRVRQKINRNELRNILDIINRNQSRIP
jgi:hypothetical protein